MNISEYLRKANDIEKALKESTSLTALDHECIIKFETAFWIDSEIIMFTEYMPGGELGKYVKDHSIDEQLAKKIFKIILEAVHYCHTHGIIHRDLKMENILLQDSTDPLSLKIIDFGIAGIWSVYGTDTSTAGTLYYTPPEVINETDLKSDPKIDIWALGVILYKILVKRFPFKSEKSNKETCKQISKKEITFKITDEMKLSKEAKHLISMLLQKNKDKRISMREIISHPWLHEVVDIHKDNTPLVYTKSSLITKAFSDEIKGIHYPVKIGTF
jgi:serine/threonine protein kinase